MKTILYRLNFGTDKFYIGITSKTPGRRMALHRHHAKTRNYPVHNAILKHPDFKMEVLAVGSWEYILDLEIRAIAAFNTLAPNGYNLSHGGEGVLGRRLTPEQCAEISKRMKGRQIKDRFGFGSKHTAESRAKISEAGKGRVFSAERRAKIGATKVGNKYGVGRAMSEEARRLSSEKQKGRPKSEAAKAAMSAAKKGKPWTEARRAAQKASLS